MRTARAFDEVHTAPPWRPTKAFERGGGVHVGDRDEAVDVDDTGEVVPRLLHLVDVRHVGHGAACVEVGKQHALVVAGQDVGRLRHEVHAAEHDELGVGLVGGLSGQPEGVAPGVRPAHHVVTLVVVPEDADPRAERGLGRADHGGQFLVGRGRVALGKRRLKSEHVVCPL